jgi:uncharacterized membrane protein
MTPGTPSPSPRKGALSRRTIIIGSVIVGVLVVAALAVWAVLAATSTADHSAAPASTSPSASSSPSTTLSASPTPGASPTPTFDPRYGAPVADTVPRDGTADFGNQLTATVVTAKSITAKGTQPGEVSGPALELTIRLDNGTGAAISVDPVTVNVYYGSQATPASPFTSLGTAFHGQLAAGAQGTGTYVFAVSKAQQESAVITVNAGGNAVVVFR